MDNKDAERIKKRSECCSFCPCNCDECLCLDENRKTTCSEENKDKKVFDILAKFEFFQGQRAGRELWFDKPKEVQDQDIADFVKGINHIRNYLQNSVVLTREQVEDFRQEIITLSHELVNSRKETAEKYTKDLVDFIHYETFRKGYELKKVEKKAYEIARKFGADIGPAPDECDCYDKENMRCNGAAFTPLCYCDGHLSRCTEYPEKRKEMNNE